MRWNPGRAWPTILVKEMSTEVKRPLPNACQNTREKRLQRELQTSVEGPFRVLSPILIHAYV